MDTNNKGQLDARTLRYMRENAEVEHTLLTPFRWLIGLGKIIICIILLFGWVLFTLCGWVFNVGEYSMENRREATCDPQAYVLRCDDLGVERFNGSHAPADFVMDPSNIHHDQPVVEKLSGDRNTTYRPGQSSAVEMDPTVAPWISFGSDGDYFLRGDDVFRRKSAQMDRALDTAARSMVSLRSEIAKLKGIDKERLILNTPAITLRRGKLPGGQYGLEKNYFVTYGMCLSTECAVNGSDLNYYLTRWDVLFNRPALGPHQQHAVEVLLQMNTLDYWLQQAHSQGVYSDSAIRRAFERDRVDLQ